MLCLQETAQNLSLQHCELKELKAIGVTSTSGTVIALDDVYQPLYPAIMYNDCRADKEADKINEAAPETPAKLGYRFQPSFALPKVLWLKENRPQIFEKTRKFLHAADFIIGRLTGNYSVSDRSNVLKAGYDFIDSKWPSFIEEKLCIELNRLPENVVYPGEIVGNICGTVSRISGLPSGIHVVAGGTDSTASMLASGAVKPGESNSTLGTTLAVKNVSTDLIKDKNGRIYCQIHPDGFWLVGGASSVGGECLEKVFHGEDLNMLNRQAFKESPTSLCIYPLVRRGERFPFVNKDAEGFITGKPGNRIELYAGYLEGVALVERWAFETLEEMGSLTGDEIHVTGGGCKSDEWLQIRANILNKPLVKPLISETAFGAAVIAASHTFYTNSIMAAQKMVEYEKIISPQKEKAGAYAEKYEEFKHVCRQKGYI